VDTGVGDVDAGKSRWLILIYQLPREPSRHRVAVWRKLKALGALYLQDGAATLPEDAATREHLEWLQLRIREAGGEATLWEALPNTIAEGKSLVEEFRASREKAYRELIEAAGRLRCEAALGSNNALLIEELGKLEREFRAERRRDYFRSPLRNEVAATLRAVRQALKEDDEAERSGKVGEG
jgi:DNA-binding transcriptional regulator PaaX